MGIRLYNAKILTMKEGEEISDGELWTDGADISYVGEPIKDCKGVRFDREINLNGNLLIPSFKNAHTHSAMTFLRSFADDLPLNDWLFKLVFPMEDKLTGEDIYCLTKLAFLEYLTSGISACFDMYFEPDHVAKAAVDTGFRTVMCGSVSGAENELDDALGRLEGFYNKFNGYDKQNGLVSYRLGFHAEYTTHLSIIKGIGGLSKKYGQPVYVHNSETASEVAGCKERHGGLTPTGLFEEAGIFEYGGGGFHTVHMTDNDLEIFKRRGLWAITNPASNAKLASGIAPVAKMRDMGIKLAIGTDGAASNNALDIFREMYLCAVLQKIKLDDAAAMPAEDVLRAAVSGSALAMGLKDCDTLEAGKKADIAVIDLNRPNMRPLNNITKNIVYSGSKENVAMTMINGRILYEGGEFNGIDAEEIYDGAERIINRIKSQV